MALSDPQSVTINSEAISLARVGMSLNEGTFQSADGERKLRIIHTAGKRNRHVVRLETVAIVSDPFAPSVNTNVSHGITFTIDGPKNGVDAVDLVNSALGLLGLIDSAFLTKVVGGES